MTLSDPLPRFQGHGVTTDVLDVLCAQLTRDLFAIARFLYYSPLHHSVSLYRQQVTLLSQRGPTMLRVIEYFVKSLKVIRNYTVGRMYPISIPLKLCLYLIPFLRYSASKNSVTLKPGVGVVQDHWKWRRSIYHTTFYWSASTNISLSCTVFELFDVE